MNPKLASVIIPTHDRATLLRGSLESLARQTLPQGSFEVIVVDDGSTDATPQVCAEFSGRLCLNYCAIEHSGISAAKNLGIFLSRAPIVVFFDDDDQADPRLLEAHLEAHRRHPEESTAILGYTAWAPGLAVSELMHYVMDVGRLLFCYTMANGQSLDFTYFWGGRSSCKRALLFRHGIFRQEMGAILEDIELGYRLSKHGLKVIFDRTAVQYMNRTINYEEFCRRCERQGRAQFQFGSLYPRDEVVAKYCQVDNAEAQWRELSPWLDQKVQRIHEIERSLGSSSHGNGSLVSELHQLYHWTFRAFKVKARVEAMSVEAMSGEDRGRRRPYDTDSFKLTKPNPK